MHIWTEKHTNAKKTAFDKIFLQNVQLTVTESHDFRCMMVYDDLVICIKC